MKLNKASMFALMAVLELASDPERQLSTGEIAARYGISPHHLAKIMRDLVHNGVVSAVRGVGGGYRFSGNLQRTTLLDIIQLFETLDADAIVPTSGQDDPPIIRELQRIATEIDDLTKAVLDTITLETALKGALQTHRSTSGKQDVEFNHIA